MLVFRRKCGQTVFVGQDVEITVLEIRGGQVKLGFLGPDEVPIHRGEVQKRIVAERRTRPSSGRRETAMS